MNGKCYIQIQVYALRNERARSGFHFQMRLNQRTHQLWCIKKKKKIRLETFLCHNKRKG